MKGSVQLSVVLVLCISFVGKHGIGDEVETTVEPSSPDAPAESLHIQIEGQTDCLDSDAVNESLGKVLGPYEDASLLSVAVVEAPAVSGSAVTLRVMMLDTSEIVLERNFTFNEADCKSAHQVLQVVLEQFLSGFPIEEWKAENRPEEPPPPEVQIKEVMVERCAIVANWLLSFGLVARFPSPSGALQISTGPDVGTEKHGFVGTLGVRVGYPHVLANGRYLETHGLIGLGWRGTFRSRFQVKILLRTGGLYVRGFGFDTDFGRWRIWLEGQIILAWRLGASTLGVDLGGSPLQHTVSISEGNEHPLTFLHLGLHWSIPIFSFSRKKNEENATPRENR